MKILSLILLMAVATIVKAQNITSKIDKFTGDTSLTTSTDTLAVAPQPLSVSCIRMNKKDKSFQGASFMFEAGKLLTIDNTRSVIIKYSNDSLLRVKWTGASKVFSAGDRIRWTMLLKKEMISKFKSLNIIAVRFETSEGNYDFDVDKNKQMAIAGQVTSLNP